jgi:hypothetical protein
MRFLLVFLGDFQIKEWMKMLKKTKTMMLGKPVFDSG